VAQTISNTESNTVTLELGNGYEVIVLDGGAIYGSGGAGVYGPNGGEVFNDGLIEGGAGAASGAGNAGQGYAGIALTQPGIIANQGTILGGAGGFGTGVNGGSGGVGVLLSGGLLTNSGLISGGLGGMAVPGASGATGAGGAGGAGVYVNGGTLVNAGIILGGIGLNGVNGDAVQFGSAAGTLLVDPGAVFKGLVVANTQADDVLELGVGNGDQGTLSGLGSQYTGFSTFTEDSGANWLLAGSNSFGGTAAIGGTLAIAGSLAVSNGVSLTGRLTVEAGASLGASYGAISVTASSGAYLLVHGTVAGGGGSQEGPGEAGISLAGGMVMNDGTVTGGSAGSGFGPGQSGGVGISLLGGMATNNGTVTGGVGGGVSFGGTGGAGVYIDGGTLINAGTIGGGSGGGSLFGAGGAAGDAVQFGSAAGTLVVDPGAVFDGLVVGNTQADDVLELGVGNGDQGTLSGLGSQYTGFSTFTEDSGANWLLAGSNSFGGTAAIGGTLAIAGSLAVSNGVSLTGRLTVEAGASLGASYGAISVTASSGAYLLVHGTVAGGAGGAQEGTGAAGISLSGGMVMNDGTVTGGSASGGFGQGRSGGVGISLSGGMATNDGTVTGGDGGDGVTSGGNGGAGISLSGGGMATNDGTVTGGRGALGSAGGAGVYIDGGTLINAGTIGGGSGSAGFSTSGAAGDAVQFGSAAGTLVVDPGAVFRGLVVASTGAGDVLQLAGIAPATLEGIGTEFDNFSTLTFDAGAAWTVDGTAAGLAAIAAITGFEYGDTIVIDNVVEDGFSYANGELTIDEASDPLVLNVGDGYTQKDFLVTTDGTNTTIDVLCYLRGTRILTPTGEVQVEDLQIGDRVVTRFGGIQRIRWIGRQSYYTRFLGKNPAKMPVRIEAGALGEGLPARALSVSPGHSMLVDRTLVLASALVNGVTITQCAPGASPAQLEYFQPELAGHDCIIAEGTWSETFADGPGLRDAFHNAAEFWALYPDYRTPETITLCAPRPLRGAGLDAALRPVVAHAAEGLAPGPLHGSIDRITETEIDGWAWDSSRPALPVLIELVLDGTVLHTALACDFREDLRNAGMGEGRCAFFLTSLALPADLLPRLKIRRASDGAPLPMSQACQATLTGVRLAA
jgi:hypothetical protein